MDGKECQTAFRAAIPRRLWRLDPFLKLVEENPIYEAFWYRRQHLRRRGFVDRFAGIRWRKIALSFVGVALILLMLYVFSGIIGLFVPLIPISIFLYIEITKGRKLGGHEMPKGVASCFLPFGYHHGVVRDLWLAGASGRTILEAVYLEEREERPGMLLIKFLMLTMLTLTVYTGIVLLWGDGWVSFSRPHHWMGGILAIWLSWELVQFDWVLHMDRIRNGVLTHIIRVWDGKTCWENYFGRILVLPVIWISILVGLFFIEVAAWIVVVNLDVVRDWMIPWIILLNVALVPLTCMMTRGMLARRFTKRLHQCFAHADGAFLQFTERELMDHGRE
ncbi:MAG: hypothetical protein JJU11_03145 [Candidatus Sumerlaeia bacterium]|nr:hypothetical protein [Candidatus Sumerlaeia bacterium]